MLHIWSDIPNHKAFGVIPKPSTVYSAHDHAKNGEPYEGVTSLQQLEDVFVRYKRKKKTIDKLDFHTHGHPGGLNIGSEVLNFRSLDRFKNKGIDQVFKPNARVFFHGCNVAESASGEYFLAKFGAIFLKTGGGRVGASTSLGVPDIIFQTGKVYHFPGDSIHAHVSPGGKVKMQHARHLSVEHIERQIIVGHTQVIPMLARVCTGNKRYRWPLLELAKSELAKAAANLSSAKTSNEMYRHLYNAHYHLDQTVKPLMTIIRNLSTTERIYLRVADLIA